MTNLKCYDCKHNDKVKDGDVFNIFRELGMNLVVNCKLEIKDKYNCLLYIKNDKTNKRD